MNRGTVDFLDGEMKLQQQQQRHRRRRRKRVGGSHLVCLFFTLMNLHQRTSAQQQQQLFFDSGKLWKNAKENFFPLLLSSRFGGGGIHPSLQARPISEHIHWVV